jgi:DNA (cytosine-5)-methyltransferase 1
VDSPKEPKNVVSFCSGYAGIERGLELAGVEARTVSYVEIEAFACANLVAKMETGALAPAPIWTDLKTFPAHLFRGRVDIITGGYPCQPFSAAGKRAGKNDPRHLWPWIRQHVDTIRPSHCFFENVEGHISLGLREVVEDLESLGYTTTWGIFSAAEVGAPHQRKRVYIMGDSEHNGLLRSEESRSSLSTSNYYSKGSEETSKSSRTSRLNVSRDIQEGKLADSNGSSSKGRRIPSGVHQKHPKSDSSCDGVGREVAQQWLPEPGLGRVVNGCPNRVDRLRLLGNGVVPQTAAKAWTTLKRR